MDQRRDERMTSLSVAKDIEPPLAIIMTDPNHCYYYTSSRVNFINIKDRFSLHCCIGLFKRLQNLYESCCSSRLGPVHSSDDIFFYCFRLMRM